MRRPSPSIALAAITFTAAAGCSSASAEHHSAPAPHPTSASASPTYDDADACMAFQQAYTTGVPASAETAYENQNNQPLDTSDYVLQESQDADPHL